MEVDKNGGVTVYGKKVTKLLVDGKQFFGGGTKLAVDNIPADAVDKVEVIDNYNEVAFLKNISNSDEMVMNIQLNYNLKTNFANASKLANRFYLQSYNSVFKGNSNLENELYHFARISYSRFSLCRGLMLTASANYTKKVDGFRNAVDFDGVNQFLTVQMLKNPNKNWSLRTSIRKRIKKIRYKLSGNYSNSNYLQSIDGDFVTNKNENYRFKAGAETLFDNFPTIEAGYKRSVGNFTSSNTSSKFSTDEPYINIDYDFLKGFIFSFDYTHYRYQNKKQSVKNQYDVANSILSYREEDSAWSFKVEAKNLFDTRLKQSNRFSDYLISDTKTYILPRIIMFSVGYNL